MTNLSRLILLVLTFTAFTLAPLAKAETELAKVNGKVITLEYFNQRYDENRKYFRFKVPSKQQVLDDMILREVTIQEAKKQKLDKDPEIVDRMNTVLYQALLEKELGKDVAKIFVSTKEAKDYYKDNPEIRTSHIFVAVPPDADEKQMAEAKKRMEDIQGILKKGKKSFSEVAQEYSEGPEAPMGGDIDYKTRNELDPAFYEAAVGLGKPGKVSGIVRTAFGFHIIKLTAVTPWYKVDRPKIKRLVFEQRLKKLYQDYLNKLLRKASVSIKTSLLK